MGTAALSFTVGGDLTHSLNMYKLLIASVLMAGAMAAPEADADAYYAAYYPALYNSHPNWPGVSTPFSSSTCFGCRGKRSAEPGYYLPGFYHGFYPGVAGHPTGTSYVARSPQGLGKRSADADAEADAGYYYGAGYGYGYARAYGYGYPRAYGYGYGYPYAYGHW